MIKKIIIFILILLLTGCAKEENLNPTLSSDTIIPSDKTEEVIDDTLTYKDLKQILIDYTNAKGCDMDVAFRIYIVETYYDILAEDPLTVLEQLENHEPIYDTEGNEIITGLTGPHEAVIVDDICRISGMK